MRGINKVIIIGNLGADPEVRQFQNGGSVTNISVATSEQWTDKESGDKKESTEWHRISLFNRLGEIAGQFLRKGSKVYIEGSLRTRKYEDSDGQERYATEIRADQMQMLDGTSGDQNQTNDQPVDNPTHAKQTNTQAVKNDDVSKSDHNHTDGVQEFTQQAKSHSISNSPDSHKAPPLDDNDIPY